LLDLFLRVWKQYPAAQQVEDSQQDSQGDSIFFQERIQVAEAHFIF